MGDKLVFVGDRSYSDDVIDGQLSTERGATYEVVDGIPDFIFPNLNETSDAQAAEFYGGRVDAYDENLHLTFKTHEIDERKTRSSFINNLSLSPSSKVLEVAAGTGRDSEIIAEHLSSSGRLYISDISGAMLKRCREKLSDRFDVPIEYHLSNALNLPFLDRSFDAVYCFGAPSEVSDVKRCFSEMARVAKVGGNVVVGATGVAPWLRETDYAKTLIKTNHFFSSEIPIDKLPVCARDVTIQWGIGYAYYLITFTVGEGEPKANFDIEIPGARGGTYRTRYEGELEGVTAEAKQLAMEACRKSNMSMHKWLDTVVRERASSELGLDTQ